MLMVYLLPHGGFIESFQRPCKFAGWPPGRELEIKQITAKLEIKRGQLRVVALGEMRDAFVRRQFHGIGFAQVQFHPAEQA